MPRRLGELLIDSGAVTPEDLEEGLSVQAGGEPDRIGEILVARGKLAPEHLARALSYQSGLPFIELGPVPPEVSDLVPLDLQVQHRLAPFELERSGQSQTLHLALADPSTVAIIEDLSMQIGMAIKVYVASADQIEATHAAYQGQDPIVWPHPSPGVPTAPAAPPAPQKLTPAIPKVKVPSAPTKLPRGPAPRPHTSPPPPPPPVAAGPAATEIRAAPEVAMPTEVQPIPEPLAALALPDWLSEPGTPTVEPPDRALMLKLETLLSHGGTGSPESAVATVLALLIRRGVLREHEVLDALGRK